MADDRFSLRLEFHGADAMFLNLLFNRFREIDISTTRAKMFTMLFYEYLNFVLEKKSADSVIDNLVKEVHRDKVSGILKEKLLEVRNSVSNKDFREHGRRISDADHELLLLGQKQFEEEFLKNKEEIQDGKSRSNSSSDSLLPNRETFTGDVSEFFID